MAQDLERKNDLPPQVEDALTKRKSRDSYRRIMKSAGMADVLNYTVELNYVRKIVRDNDALMAAAQTNPQSLVTALVDLAQLGLSLSTTLGHAYLVPRKVGGVPTVLATPSYKGIVHIAMSSGAVQLVQAVLVHQNDKFKVETKNNVRTIEHVEAREKRGAMTHVYTLATFAAGVTHVEVMDARDIEAIKQAAIRQNERSGGEKGQLSPAWRFFESEMWKKSCIRRASKSWPKITPRLQSAFALTDKAEGIDFGEKVEREHVDEAELCMRAEQVHQLGQMIPDSVLDPADIPGNRAYWLESFAKALGFDSIGDVPTSKYDDLAGRIKVRVDKVLAARKGAQP